MTCAHCSAVEQRGRFCVGCGRRMPFSLSPVRPVRVAPRRALDETQPVLRLGVHAYASVGTAAS
jgi:hypothetical protein